MHLLETTRQHGISFLNVLHIQKSKLLVMKFIVFLI